MNVEWTHHAYDLHPAVGCVVKLEFTDGEVYTVAAWERPDEDLDRMPEVARELVDAFLWGDGSRSIVAVVAAEDMARQSRRVRSTLPPG